ncbi:hypothetical protein [Pseudonocardia alaniniphila]|uniref:Aldo/keto reductase family protein n=1 Tax=Pseudonocardia alaniniphila TaxID=75291 RepID=A0ABS9TTS9_9PSEU|nr:hypothetical protein [Pseudonocardia alaniniphila]MCH6171907.1 hypothetical protein [Pseudonocardia alaniniphila]
MDTRRMGTDGPQVSALGPAAMGMSDLYGPADEAESIATIQAATETRGTDVVPLVGARLQESLAAADLVRSDEVIGAIEAAVPAGDAAGERYPEQQMAGLDSEG